MQYLSFNELSLSEDFCVTYTTEFQQLSGKESAVIWTNLPLPYSLNDRGPAVLSYIKGNSINNSIFLIVQFHVRRDYCDYSFRVPKN